MASAERLAKETVAGKIEAAVFDLNISGLLFLPEAIWIQAFGACTFYYFFFFSPFGFGSLTSIEMASMVETFGEYLDVLREEMFELKKAIKDVCREVKEELLLGLALAGKDCVGGVLSAPPMEQLKQDKEEDVMDFGYQADKESLEDRELEGEQDVYQLRSADFLLSKNYKTPIKAQLEGLEVFDLSKGDQYYYGNYDQFKMNVFLNVTKYEFRVLNQQRLYFKGGKASCEDIGNLKESVLKKGEEQNIQRVCKGRKGLSDLMMVIRLIKYNFYFDSKD